MANRLDAKNTEFMVDLNMGHYYHTADCIAVRKFPAVYKSMALKDIRELDNRSGNKYAAHDCVRVLGRRFV